MLRKKGQAGPGAGGSAVLIILIAIVMILYILFLPPDDRAELLGENGTSTSDDTTLSGINKTVLKEHVGRLDYLRFDYRVHDIPSFRIYSNIEGTVLKSLDSLYTKTTIFDEISKEVAFSSDESLTDNVLLSFNVKEGKGRLIISLNDHEIFNREIDDGTPNPVIIPKEYLEEKNSLIFKVSKPKFAFWRINDYLLENILITGDITDLSQSESIQNFYLSDVEINNIDAITLRFYPSCDIKEVGPLTVKLNGYKIYSTVADCGVYTSLSLDENDLFEGKNELEFLTPEGSYLIDRVSIKTQLEEVLYPVFYFDLDDSLFDENDDLKSNFNVSLVFEFVNDDEKRAELKLNGRRTHLRTFDLEYAKEINSYVESGSNSIEIIPETVIDIRELRVEIEEEE